MTTNIAPLIKFAKTCGVISDGILIPQVLPICLGNMRRARNWTFRVYDEEEGYYQLRVKAGMDYGLADVVEHLMDDPSIDDVLAVNNGKSRVWHTINTK